MSKPNPIEEALTEKVSARSVKDLELWTRWNENGRKPEHLEPLLDAYQPLITRKTHEWRPPAIAPQTMEAEITKHVIEAFRTYDPKRGAAINTHVQNRIQKSKRFMTQYQNVAYIPEPQAYQIGNISRATDFLSEDLGRAPTAEEVADHLKMPVRQVVKIQKSIRKDVPGSSLETDPMPKLGPREQEVLSLLPGVLTPDEKAVFDLIFAVDPSKRVTSTSEIGKRIGKNPSQVSRLKTSVINKAKQYM